MDPSSQFTDSSAFKLEGTLLRALDQVGHQPVAAAIGRDVSLISKWKDEGRFSQTARVIAALGLKIVPRNVKCYEPQYVEALQTLAREGLKKEAPQKLEW